MAIRPFHPLQRSKLRGRLPCKSIQDLSLTLFFTLALTTFAECTNTTDDANNGDHKGDLESNSKSDLPTEIAYIIIAILCVIVLIGIIVICVRSYNENSEPEDNKDKKEGRSTYIFHESEAYKAIKQKLIEEKEFYGNIKGRKLHRNPEDKFKPKPQKIYEEEDDVFNPDADLVTQMETSTMKQKNWRQNFKGASKKALTLAISQELSDDRRKGLRGGLRRRVSFKYEKEIVQVNETQKIVGSVLVQRNEYQETRAPGSGTIGRVGDLAIIGTHGKKISKASSSVDVDEFRLGDNNHELESRPTDGPAGLVT